MMVKLNQYRSIDAICKSCKRVETKLHDNEQLLATFADNLEEQIEI